MAFNGACRVLALESSWANEITLCPEDHAGGLPMLSEAEREAGGGAGHQPRPPQVRDMRLAAWGVQPFPHFLFGSRSTVPFAQERQWTAGRSTLFPRYLGPYDQEHRALCSWQSIPNAQNRPIISLSCGAAWKGQAENTKMPRASSSRVQTWCCLWCARITGVSGFALYQDLSS